MAGLESPLYENNEYFANDPEFPLSILLRSPQNPTKFHKHEYWECAFVTAGSGMHRSENNQPIAIRHRDIIIIPPGGSHAFVETENLEVINLLFDASRLPSLLMEFYSHPVYRELFIRNITHYENRDFPKFSIEPAVFDELEEYLCRMASAGYEQSEHCYKLGLFMALISKLCNSKSFDSFAGGAAPLDIGKLSAYLHRNFARKITLELLTKITGMSKPSLFRHFRAAFGVTPITYLQRIRLQYASELLINSGNSIKEIALQTGFQSESYFFRTFRKFYGITPMEYRKKQSKQSKTK